MLPRFYEHLKQRSHALELFCHRWLLLCFQREFSEDVIIRMIYPYLCQSVLNFIKDHIGMKADKGCYASFAEVPTRHKVRDLITSKTGTLICISRRVVRTHPVHPELVLGTFMCLDCQREISKVEQQFKFANPSTCRNPTVQAGDRYDFTDTLIVVPDVGVLKMPGAKADYGSRHKPGEAPEGLTGLKALVRYV
ncbi:hypothetical protein GQX74_004925 [Glossina fuscipes]|nr:hypothetical protein GQX74_004925 [Glossina fuscipes]